MSKPVKHLLRSWMWKRQMTSKEVAEALNITLPAVNRYIAGTMTSNRISRWLLEQGCPPRVFRRAEKKQRKAA